MLKVARSKMGDMGSKHACKHRHCRCAESSDCCHYCRHFFYFVVKIVALVIIIVIIITIVIIIVIIIKYGLCVCRP